MEFIRIGHKKSSGLFIKGLVAGLISFPLVILFLFRLSLGQIGEPFYIIPVRGVIDLGLSSFIKRSISEAKENNARIIILEIDTFGGRVDAAVEITDGLEKAKPISTVAFIDDQAWSAGALIALACERIVMSPGSSIGSAEPRAIGFAGKDEITDEKIVSAIRAKFKSLAEENNHPVNLALAMADKDFEIKQVRIKDEIKILTTQEIEEIRPLYQEKEIQILKTISPKGKLLNLTASEAKEFGLADAILDNRSALIKHLGLEEKYGIQTEITWSELLVRFLTHPIVSALLLTLGFLGLLFELRIPGWGISGTLGLIFLALFFGGHYLAGLANRLDILIFLTGITLLFLEVAIIPGFGIAGILGIALILGGVFLALIKTPLTLPRVELYRALSTIGYSIILTFLTILISFRFLPETGLWKKIILRAEERKEEGFQVDLSLQTYVGKIAKAQTVLRPAGKVICEDKILDAISEGDFIDRDKKVEIIRVEENRLIVREYEDA